MNEDLIKKKVNQIINMNKQVKTKKLTSCKDNQQRIQTRSRSFNNKPLVDNVIRDKSLGKLASSDKTVKSLPTCRRKTSKFNICTDDLPRFSVSKDILKKKMYSDSFKKYGISLPSVEDIVTDEKHLSTYKTQLLEVERIVKQKLVPCLSPKKNSTSQVILLDCKHLNLDNISEYFHSKINYLRNILTGKINCVRHRIFCTNETSEDLTYNNSMIVFNFNQIEHILTLMEKEFETDTISQKNESISQLNKKSYFFKVLIPVFCLEVFMKEHNMSKYKANIYLNKRPIE